MSDLAARARCRSAVAACAAELGWDLDDGALDRYAAAVAALVDDPGDGDQLRTVIVNFHLDHREVAALRDAAHPDHERAWASWMGQILAILRRAGLASSSDRAVDAEDLAQLARAEVARNLASFRYRSRIGRWVQQVAIRCVQRQIRDGMAQKRAARPDSLSALPPGAEPADDRSSPEIAASTGRLLDLVGAILAEQPDQRLRAIFHLWAVEDRRVEEIGGLVRLHPSRVRALLQQARLALQAHPAIRSWRTDDPDEGRP